MARINLPGPAELSPEQRRIYDAVVAGPRGTVIGPLRAAIHSPELAERWSKLGEVLRFDTVLPRHLNELAILVTGRRWGSQIEWWVHARAAADAGLSAAVIEAIRVGEPPEIADPAEAEVYEYSREIQQTGQVPMPVYRAVKERWGERGVVELTAVIGYYTMVSMTLNAHEIPLPDGVEPPLRPLAWAGKGLPELPPARCTATAEAKGE